jgi:hypothetical protein
LDDPDAVVELPEGEQRGVAGKLTGRRLDYEVGLEIVEGL